MSDSTSIASTHTVFGSTSGNSNKLLLNFLPCINPAEGNAGKRIAHLSLNKPAALHALDLDMVNAMLDALAQLKGDNTVQAVLLDSTGDKAFCAGGDIVSMYHAMKQAAPAQRGDINAPTPEFLQAFFTQEYRLDYCLHTFDKPIIVWGNGIIMGGGLGLFTASQIKLVTQSARIAMPEISIGLFPDVGGSYFLNRLPKGVGLFLGLTGASINAQDTVDIGLADASVSHENKKAFIEGLCKLKQFDKPSVLNMAALTAPVNELAKGKLTDIMTVLSSLNDSLNVLDAKKRLASIVDANPDNTYLSKAFATLEAGSAITAHLVFEQLKRAQQMSLADCFRMELSMAFTCGALGEFEEGVRALLIDKDHRSDWLYQRIEDVPEQIVAAHFKRFKRKAKTAHPLHDLERDFGR